MRTSKGKSPGYLSNGHWVECQVCGRVLRGMHAQVRWDGFVVCSDDFELRHSLDKIRPRTSRTYPVGPLRPPGPNQFIDNNDPFTSDTMIDGTHDIFDNLGTQRVIDENTVPGRDPPTVTMVTFPKTSDLNAGNHSWLFTFRHNNSNVGLSVWLDHTVGAGLNVNILEADARQPSAVGLNLLDSTLQDTAYRPKSNAAGTCWVASFDGSDNSAVVYYGTTTRKQVGATFSNVLNVTDEFDSKGGTFKPTVGWWVTKPKFDGTMIAYAARLKQLNDPNPADFEFATKSIAVDGTVGAEVLTTKTLTTTHTAPPSGINPVINNSGNGDWRKNVSNAPQTIECYNPLIFIHGLWVGAGHTVKGVLGYDFTTGNEFPWQDEDDGGTPQALNQNNILAGAVAKDADSGTVYCAIYTHTIYAGHSAQGAAIVRVDKDGNWARIWHIDIDADANDIQAGWGCDEWGIYVATYPPSPADEKLKFKWYTWDGTLKLSWTSELTEAAHPDLWTKVGFQTGVIGKPYTMIGHVVDGLTSLNETLT